MNKIFFAIIALVMLSGILSLGPYRDISSAYAQEDWKKEFEEICSRTDDAMSFSKEELKGLIERCDRLKPVIERQDESTRKVYLRRLQTCRDLLKFVLESKESSG